MQSNNESSLIIRSQGDQKLSKEQKQFNNSIKKIQQIKDEMLLIEENILWVQQKIQKEISPLEGELVQKKIAWVKGLDEAYQQKFFRKNEKALIAQIIEEDSFELIHHYGISELLELHDQYAVDTYEEYQQEQKEFNKMMTQSYMKNFYGIDVNPEEFGDLDEPENFFRFKAKVEEQIQQKEEERKKYRKEPKKTQKQLEKEKIQEEETKNINKSARTIYTELAKELHPDLESDEFERDRKTELMKEVTNAYNKNDLYTLLRLQLEYLGNKITKVGSLVDEKLRYYNKLLKDQIQELQLQKITQIQKYPELSRFNISGNKNQINYRFRKEKNDLKELIAVMEARIKILSDKAGLRNFLKNINQQEDDDDFFFFHF
ncbi:MAG: hypothetical protein NW226_26305 [Microscillaceae bacterium]|nr:hypothetical protein [Microscillaceae bacterium]